MKRVSLLAIPLVKVITRHILTPSRNNLLIAHPVVQAADFSRCRIRQRCPSLSTAKWTAPRLRAQLIRAGGS